MITLNHGVGALEVLQLAEAGLDRDGRGRMARGGVRAA
jgi:hypothetical protein